MPIPQIFFQELVPIDYNVHLKEQEKIAGKA
jgi:hypothetical protein